MTKKDIIHMLEEIAIYLELNLENNFRVSAYRRAANALESDNRSLSEMDSFKGIKGIGKGTEALINTYLETGKSELLEELKAHTPGGLVQMTKIPGLGAKRVAKIYEATGIVTIDELKSLCENNELQKLPGFGKKTEENILNGITELLTKPDRYPIDQILKFRRLVEDKINEFEFVEKYDVAGSARRFKETSGDLDYIVKTSDVSAFISNMKESNFFKSVIAEGEKKFSIVIKDDFNEINTDFRFIQGDEYYSTLQHFTGSKDHNVRMRQIAKTRGESISEYGVKCEDGRILTFDSEAAFYKYFDVPFIPPSMRETGQEIDMDISNIVTLDDIRGDIHMHTTYSDGAMNIEEMVEACIERGYEYMVITDHSKSLVVANGLNETRLYKQIEEIKKLNDKYTEIDIYAGTEMDILADGTLDFSDDTLQALDYVIAAIHSSFSQSEAEIMERLKNACYNPYVRHIAHPTGRIIGARNGYRVNMDELIMMAKETHTVLEVNANPKRLDLSADVIKHKDLMLTVNTDAHHTRHLDFMKYGIATLQKGLIRKDQVVNTMSREAFKQFIKNGK
ncbi:DNA polymerase/3'-5' exonuclease PolX [Phocicoccus pinnipedialis]|uniref:DNA polymerase/3'-5' exonuclease PolX n=1 Tax=Phocicoccus pinnipedialis TaxID=110845 RepID=UPI00163F18D3|nr:DNA polymerase/3'-5' exonuclease PolX [Jeotgalicoccus pinnipedialis]